MKKVLLTGAAAALLAFTFQANASWYVSATSDAYATKVYDKTAKKHNGEKIKGGFFRLESGNEYVSFGYKASDIDYDKKSNSKDISGLKDVYGLFHHKFGVSNNLTFNTVAGLAGAWEKNFKFKKSYEATLVGSVEYHTNNLFSIEAGAGVLKTKPKTMLYPVLEARYSNARAQGVSFVLGFPKNELNYRFNDWFAVKSAVVLGDYNSNSSDYSNIEMSYIKLGKNNQRAQNGYLSDQTYSARLAAEFNPHKAVDIDVGLAYTFKHNIKFYDQKGHKTENVKLKKGISLFLTGAFHF